MSGMTDSLGHTTRFAYHPGLGVLLASEDANKVRTTWQVDGFGRIRSEKVAGGDSNSVSYGAQPGTPLPLITQTLSSGPQQVDAFDALGRLTRETTTTRGDGRPVAVDLHYDDFGRGLTAVSQPHFLNDPPVYTTAAYDNLGRLRFLHGPDGSTIQLRYDGLTTYRFDAKGNERRQVEDQLGRVVQTSDITPAAELTTRYSYGPFDVLRTITDPNGNTVTIGYDRLGRKIHLIDPDGGRRDYTYNAFGDLSTETADHTDVTAYLYDTLGRITQITSRDGLAKYNWDTAANGIGLLGSTTSPDGIVTRQTYDSFARPRDTTWKVGSQSFTMTRIYDTYGRLATLAYPAVPGHPTRFAVDYKYAPAGDLDSVLQHGSKSPTTYYTVLDTDAQGNPTNPSGAFTQAKLGNGLTVRATEDPSRPGYPQRIETLGANGLDLQRLDLHFDANGNLAQRRDAVAGTSESFRYDFRDQLTAWTWSGAGVTRHRPSPTTISATSARAPSPRIRRPRPPTSTTL